MEKHTLLGIVLFMLIILPVIVNAQPAPGSSFGGSNSSGGSNTRTKRPLTVPFGGRVISLTVPTVTCTPADGGTVPVVLSSNLAGVARAGFSAVDPNQDALQKINNIGVGIYRAIPLYTLRIGSTDGKTVKQPQIGDWVLGRQKLIPNLGTCQISAFGTPIPFPVVETDNYGTSRTNRLRY